MAPAFSHPFDSALQNTSRSKHSEDPESSKCHAYKSCGQYNEYFPVYELERKAFQRWQGLRILILL